MKSERARHLGWTFAAASSVQSAIKNINVGCAVSALECAGIQIPVVNYRIEPRELVYAGGRAIDGYAFYIAPIVPIPCAPKNGWREPVHPRQVTGHSAGHLSGTNIGWKITVLLRIHREGIGRYPQISRKARVQRGLSGRGRSLEWQWRRANRSPP